jgi:hypothetical protein
MSKQLIQFAGVLFMLAALLAVSAQESTTASNNATMNNTALLNNTTLNASLNETFNVTTRNEIVMVQNETSPAQNVTMPENITAVVEPVSKASPMPVVSRPQVAQIGSPKMVVFVISSSERAPSLFSIDGKALPQAAYEVGLPAKTIMDLGALPF